MKKLFIAILLLILFGAGCGRAPASVQPASGGADAPATPVVEAPPQPAKLSNQPRMLQKPELTIDKSKTYTAVLKTSVGDIAIALNAAATPVTVNNFVYLARNDFYSGTPFHRAISGFMIQGGDPKGDGTGGPGYRFNDEPFSGAYRRGTVAMANAGPNTNGSQFFIMHADYPLPPNYVIFGRVTAGLEVVDKIATAPVTVGASGEQSKPVTPVIVQSVEVVEKYAITVKLTMQISSPAFGHNEKIPKKYTCDGEDISPPLTFVDVPEGAKSLALIHDDPDAPAGTWVHWTIWNIAPRTREIAERSVPEGATEGAQSWERTGYGGPCPPSGTHRYFFKLYALDIMLDLPASTDVKGLEAAMAGHILAATELIGLYARQ